MLKQNLVRNAERGIQKLEESSGLGFEEIVNILRSRRLDNEEKTIPVSVFDNGKLSALEAIVKYMREELGLRYSEIAALLNRNDGPIGVTYRNSAKKFSGRLDCSSELRLPLSVFENTRLSVLENISLYLKRGGMSNHEIAAMLRRDDRTIWTVLKRAEVKLG